VSGGTPAAAATIGLALSDARLVAVRRAADGRVVWREVALPEPLDAWRGAVHEALRGLVGDAAPGVVQVRGALLAPLVEVRAATLPPVPDADARRLLGRNAARHFLHATEPLRTGVGAPHRAISSVDGSTPAVTPAATDPRDVRLAAGAPTRRLRAVEEAVTACGARLAWMAPAAALWPAAATPASGHALLVHATHAEWLSWRNGQLEALRKARHDAVHELVPRGASVLVLRGSPDPAAVAALAPCLEEVRRAGGTELAPGRVDGAGDERDAARLAAWCCLVDERRDARAVPLALIDDDAAGAPPARGRTAGPRALALAAALLLAGSLGYGWWLERDLASVRRERAALGAALERRGLRAGPGEPATLARVAGDSLAAHVPWSVLLGDAASRLPADAWVRTLAARGDSLVLELVARDATGAWSALDASPRLEDVAVTGPVRRERTVDGTISERITVRARRAHAAPAAATRGGAP
jgi:hypothetical protein